MIQYCILQQHDWTRTHRLVVKRPDATIQSTQRTEERNCTPTRESD